MHCSSNSLIDTVARVTLTKGRPGSRVTFFPSRKNGGAVTCGNLMQAEFCVQLEYRRDVVSYQCRPPTLRKDDLRYKADFLVALNGGPAVYLKFLPPDNQPSALTQQRIQAVEAMLAEHDLEWRWLTRADLPEPLAGYNLRYLYHYSFGSSQRAARRVQAQVDAMAEQRATFETLIACGAAPADICHAIFLDELQINLKHHLTPQTMIYGGHDGHL